MMLDRTQEPAIKEMTYLSLPILEKQILSNDIPLHIVNMGETDVCRLDVIFNAGKYDQQNPLEAEMCNVLLKEGTQKHTSAEIAEKLDYYGAWMQNSVSQHNSYITLYSLNKFFEETMQMLFEILQEPVFPRKEFKTLLQRRKRQYIVESEKVDALASRELSKHFFGESHPYGHTPTMGDYETLTIENVQDYHKRFYTAANCMLIITGKITPEMIRIIETLFGQQFANPNQEFARTQHTLAPSVEKYAFVEKEDAMQSAVRLAMKTVKRDHPHCFGVRVLNTILGGYFGSRLMSNVREKKGYTYGINSMVCGLRDISYLLIATQTGTQFTQPLTQETLREIDRLAKEPIDEEELTCVKRYMLGELCRYFDGPFSAAESYISLLVNNLDLDYYNRQFEYIKNVDRIELQKIAQEYFSSENFYLVIAGREK